MGTTPIDPRPPSAPERALLRRLLDFALDPAAADAYRADLEDLVVVEVCDCGCPSVVFAAPRPTPDMRRTMVADVYGTTPEGFALGLLLWAVQARLGYLEVYTLGNWPPYGLPAPETVTEAYPPSPSAA